MERTGAFRGLRGGEPEGRAPVLRRRMRSPVKSLGLGILKEEEASERQRNGKDNEDFWM